MNAGVASCDITPPLGGILQGRMRRDAVATWVESPLAVRVAVFEADDGARAAIVQLDLLSIRWTQTDRFRRAIAQAYGFPAAHILVAATHNHRGPPAAGLADIPRDEDYLERLTEIVVRAFGAALDARQPARLGAASVLEWDLAVNRRLVLRDGTVGKAPTPDCPPLCIEGPTDPEVAVLGVQDTGGRWLGLLVNYATHPNCGWDKAMDTALGAGIPGHLERALRADGVPLTLFLNGAAGNQQVPSPRRRPLERSEAEAAAVLTAAVRRALPALAFEDSPAIRVAARTLELPFRQATPEDIAGTAPGARRAGPPGLYDRVIPGLLRRMRARGANPAEVQALRLGSRVLLGIPGELFVELGLAIKERCHPRHALVIGYANGMVGYLPTRAAFARGGYETTFTSSSRLAPEAGDLLVEAAVDLARTVAPLP